MGNFSPGKSASSCFEAAVLLAMFRVVFAGFSAISVGQQESKTSVKLVKKLRITGL